MVVYILLTVKQNNICGFIWVIRVCPTLRMTGDGPAIFANLKMRASGLRSIGLLGRPLIRKKNKLTNGRTQLSAAKYISSAAEQRLYQYANEAHCKKLLS